jgi:hypothetical protein
MATHDYIISNASGAAVRADLNNALAAIATNNSSATEPTTTYAYQWWADTGSSPTVMKLRNSANSAWITLFQLDGEWSLIPFENGTAAAPSIYFKDSGTDTGLFSGGTDQVNITTGGTERVEWGTSEVVFNDSGANYDFRIEGDTNANLFFVDASADAVGIGTTSPATALAVNGNITLADSGTGSSYLTTVKGGNSIYFGVDNSTGSVFGSGTAYSPIIYTGAAAPITFSNSGTERARIDSSGRLLVGTSTASRTGTLFLQGSSAGATGDPTLVLARGLNNPSDGATLGALVFTDSGHGDAAQIYASRDGGTWNTSTSRPTRLTFSTCSDGSASPAERMRIRNTGYTSIYSTGGDTLIAHSSSAAGTANYVIRAAHSATGVADGTVSFQVTTNGNVQNTNGSYTTLSDSKLKENIVDAHSQWNDLKAIQIRNWNFKEETGYETHRQIGPIAQELEEVCPGLVFETPDRDEDGNETGEVTKGVNQSVLYMKAVKALQEAMERIEQLEASNADLLARVTALEAS